MTLLKDKVAIVTGASKGLGEGIAIRMAEEGAKVVVMYNSDLAGAEGVVQTIKKAGGTAIAKKGNVTDYKEIEKCIAEVHDLWGSIDILVNNAGVLVAPSPFMETSEADWNYLTKVDFIGILVCTQICAKYMIKQNAGRIIHISADAARIGLPNLAVYSGAKSAAFGFTKTLAKELADNNITVNCLCPGPCETPIIAMARSTPDGRAMVDQVLANIPLRRMGMPSEVGDAVVFYASNMGKYHTGQIMSINGGWSMAD